MSEHAFRKISRRSGSRRESGETLPIEAWKGSSKFSSKKTASRSCCCCPYGPLPSSQHHLQQQPALSPAAGVVVVAATAELIFRFRELCYQSQVQQAMLLLMAAPLLLLLWSWLVQQQARNGGRFFFFNIYVSFLPEVALHNSCFVLLRSMSGAAASASYIPA